MARILVAEDEPHLLRVITLWLERHGHEVIATANGADAMQIMQRGAPDLLIADVNMPVMDGVELVRRCRQQGISCRGVIVLSSRCDQQQLRDRLAWDEVVLHPKPFSPSRLVEEVSRLLARSSAPGAADARSPEANREPVVVAVAGR